ncbi:hypothetical protein [Aureispira sp. CCB-QB1]|uniref:hypothetical protein n=1 Tax=Aureispira sp. CCB-QB1 TaxID=1313421 RepID=UPI000697468E|nr:hypothetical protein [Aureispira sp. CCB-QB1]
MNQNTQNNLGTGIFAILFCILLYFIPLNSIESFLLAKVGLSSLIAKSLVVIYALLAFAVVRAITKAPSSFIISLIYVFPPIVFTSWIGVEDFNRVNHISFFTLPSIIAYSYLGFIASIPISLEFSRKSLTPILLLFSVAISFLFAAICWEAILGAEIGLIADIVKLKVTYSVAGLISFLVFAFVSIPISYLLIAISYILPNISTESTN